MELQLLQPAPHAMLDAGPRCPITWQTSTYYGCAGPLYTSWLLLLSSSLQPEVTLEDAL